MKKELSRLALLQTMFICYSIVGIGLILKVRYGSPAPANLFATHVRDYGFLLLILPTAWFICAVLQTNKPGADHQIFIKLCLSGLALTGVLGIIAFFATLSALVHNTLIHAQPQAPAMILNRQLPNEQ